MIVGRCVYVGRVIYVGRFVIVGRCVYMGRVTYVGWFIIVGRCVYMGRVIYVGRFIIVGRVFLSFWTRNQNPVQTGTTEMATRQKQKTKPVKYRYDIVRGQQQHIYTIMAENITCV